MAGGDALAAQLPGAVEQRAELQFLVAHHARIGRAPGLVFLGKVGDDLLLKRVRLVNQIIGNAQLVADGARVHDRLRAATFVLGAGDAILRPELERDADHVVALLQKQSAAAADESTPPLIPTMTRVFRVTLSPQAQATIPTHVAVIMDGNGRWAKQRRCRAWRGTATASSPSARNRARGGRGGHQVLDALRFFRRELEPPQGRGGYVDEVSGPVPQGEIGELNRNNVRLDAIGQIYRLPEFVQEQLEKTKAALAKNNGLTLILALSYGGRTEIVEAVRSMAQKVKDGKLEPAEINEQVVSQHLYTCHYPDPDLLIRTSGEMRISNFLLWQISYAELVVTPTLVARFPQAAVFRGAGRIHPAPPAVWIGLKRLCRNQARLSFTSIHFKAARSRCPRAPFSSGACSASWSCGRWLLARCSPGTRRFPITSSSDHPVLAVSGLLEFYGMARKLNYACYSKWGVCGGVLMILFTFVCISGQFGVAGHAFAHERPGNDVHHSVRARFVRAPIHVAPRLHRHHRHFHDVVWNDVRAVAVELHSENQFLRTGGGGRPYYVLYFVLVTKFSDCGAYAVGSLIGKHKMIPRISPGKTWEGFGGAVVVSTAASVIFARLAGSHLAGMTLTHSIILGIILSLAAVVGDLIESLFKREAGLKDSGHFSRHRRHSGFIGQPAVQRADHVSVSAACVDVSCLNAACAAVH
jgi:undecaprenyl diphosphate synthase